MPTLVDFDRIMSDLICATKLACAGLLASAVAISAAAAETITTTAADGATVYGETYYADLPATAPMIALFHQAGANGRGEYGPLTEWLNGLGYRLIAFDQRSGGGYFGQTNRTAEGVGEDRRYCDAYPDIEAAIAYAHGAAGGAPLVIWGSSYSASLVFAAAADHPDLVDAVVAFSPATGGELDRCGAKKGLPNLKDPALAVWPKTEKSRATRLNKLLKAANAEVIIVKNGVHGSSTLVDARTQHDMSAARAGVAEWLQETLAKTD